MELKQDPEIAFLDECIKFLAELNEKVRALQLEYDILKGIMSPPSDRTDNGGKQ